jgi:hypothetical protein
MLILGSLLVLIAFGVAVWYDWDEPVLCLAFYVPGALLFLAWSGLEPVLVVVAIVGAGMLLSRGTWP